MKVLLLLLSMLLIGCEVDNTIPPCCDSTGKLIMSSIKENGDKCTLEIKAVCNKTAVEQQRDALDRLGTDSLVSFYWKCY